MFQRPERASFISTFIEEGFSSEQATSRFNALNGLLSFLREYSNVLDYVYNVFQRPERASFISTNYSK